MTRIAVPHPAPSLSPAAVHQAGSWRRSFAQDPSLRPGQPPVVPLPLLPPHANPAAPRLAAWIAR
ncbi:hypothetical protein [Roseomonas sp. 18066]|uniref:hypothetical protein n=1 Tax=Roseomonas sp. 18066 TaxID=2681412 RepID=UPI0013589402|nr:hypothetical protein [Roseomonas sp. 18066]